MPSYEFRKYQSSGNDFIIIEDLKRLFSQDSSWIRKLCHRKFGVGSDGLILLQPSQKADFQMRFFNPDGSEVSMCGNGLRCLAHFIRSLGNKKNPLLIETAHGNLSVTFQQDLIDVSLGKPKILDWGFVPQTAEFTCYAVHTGVPHLIIFSDDIEEIDLSKEGRSLRMLKKFQPEGINVNFIKKIQAGHYAIRTYERGVEEETLSCGTGAGAAAFVAQKLGDTSSSFKMVPKSQDTLHVRCGEEITVAGVVSLVFRGEIA